MSNVRGRGRPKLLKTRYREDAEAVANGQAPLLDPRKRKVGRPRKVGGPVGAATRSVPGTNPRPVGRPRKNPIVNVGPVAQGGLQQPTDPLNQSSPPRSPSTSDDVLDCEPQPKRGRPSENPELDVDPVAHGGLQPPTNPQNKASRPGSSSTSDGALNGEPQTKRGRPSENPELDVGPVAQEELQSRSQPSSSSSTSSSASVEAGPQLPLPLEEVSTSPQRGRHHEYEDIIDHDDMGYRGFPASGLNREELYPEFDSVVAENWRNVPTTSNADVGNRSRHAIQRLRDPNAKEDLMIPKVFRQVQVIPDIEKMLNTRMDVLEEAPIISDSDAIPLLILEMLRFESCTPESPLIDSLLNMDTDLLDYAGPHRRHFKLFRNMVRMVGHVRRMMSQRSVEKSRKILEEISEVVLPYRESTFSEGTIAGEIQDGNRSKKEVWRFAKPFLVTIYYFVKTDLSKQHVVDQFDKLAARWRELLDQYEEDEDVAEVVDINGSGSVADLLIEAVIKAKNECILRENEVERYSPEAINYMEMAEYYLEELFMQEILDWNDKRKPNMAKGKLIKAEKEHKDKVFTLRLNKWKVSVAKLACTYWNSHVAAELLSMVERSLCPDTPLPTFRQLGSPPRDLLWHKTFLLAKPEYAEDLKYLHNVLREDFMKNGRMNWKKAHKLSEDNFIPIDELLMGTPADDKEEHEDEPLGEFWHANWDWQMKAMNILGHEFMKLGKKEEEAYGKRLMDLIRSIFYTNVTEWKRQGRPFNVVLEWFSSYAKDPIKLDEHRRPELQEVIERFEGLNSVFGKKQMPEVLKVAEAWSEKSMVIASYVGKPAIDNYFGKKEDSRYWHATYETSNYDESSIGDALSKYGKRRNSAFSKKTTGHLGPFVYAFWRCIALLVATKDGDNILTMCDILRKVIRVEAADMRNENDFCATLEALEKCIRAFVSSDEEFDSEVVAKLVRVGMDMLAKNLALDREEEKEKKTVTLRDLKGIEKDEATSEKRMRIDLAAFDARHKAGIEAEDRDLEYLRFIPGEITPWFNQNIEYL